MAKRLLLLACLVVAAPLACARGGQDQRRVVPAVNVEVVDTLEKSQPKIFVGSVEGAETVSAVARVSGTLLRANFREGSLIKEGDVLYEIEDTVYAAQVAIAQALIEQCEADHELAIKEHERSAGLFRSKAISEQAFDNTLSTQKLKKAKLDEARASLILATHDLRHCRIVSPISGRIGEKLYSEGNYITPALGVLATVVQYQPIKVRFSMSENDFFRFFSSHDTLRNVELEIVRANGRPYTGKITPDFVDNRVDPRTDTITVHLECDNPDDQLLPGGYVQVFIAEKFERAMPSVLTSALMTDGTRHYVYVLDGNNVVERRDVEIGPLVRRRQVITGGLRPGERVVTGGLNKVSPGDTVNPNVVPAGN